MCLRLTNTEDIFPIGSNNIVNQYRATWLTSTFGVTESKNNVQLSYNHEDPVLSDSHRESATDVAESTLQNTSSPSELVQYGSTVIMEEEDAWQVVGEDMLVVLTEQDVSRLVDLFPGAPCFDLQGGLNCALHGQCDRCEKPLMPASTFLDFYDAHVYCINCHQLQESIIPRDVIYNWDFSSQPVSRPTKSFLNCLYHKPVINLAKLNPTLYAVIPELFVIRQLRRAITLLWHQIARCDAKAAADLRYSIQPLDYVLFSLHDLDLYSLQDLCQVQSGQLEVKLVHAITGVALSHVRKCLACRRRALLCDKCQDLRRPIWPHEFSSYKRCATSGCLSVMHVDCLPSVQLVPSVHVPCLGCHNSKSLMTETRSNSSEASRCRTCTAYADVLPPYITGHYADPALVVPHF